MDNKKKSKRKIGSGIGFFYLGLALLRIILVIFQRGYIHPDEYFQSTEIIIGDLFQAERSEIWEFDKNFPIRNIAIPYLFIGLPCVLYKWIINLTNFQGTVSPYHLLIFPRLVMCLLSFVVDFSLINICQKCITNVKRRILLLASSYVMLIYGSRTFSNTIEMILFSALLRVVVINIVDAKETYPQEMKLKTLLKTAENPRQKVLILRQLKQLSHHDYNGSLEIGLLIVVGVFNRPTFLVYAVVPVFFWLYRGPPLRKISFYTVHFRCIYLISVIAPITLVLVWVDTVYYKRQDAFNFLYNYGLSGCLQRIENCIIITPLNFLMYNSNSQNLAEHGIHPRYLHLANIILLYNVLGINCLNMVVSVVIGILKRKYFNLMRFNIVDGLMFFSIIIPMVILSLIPHQEPRFLIPLTLPIIFLSGLSMLNIFVDKSGKTKLQWKKILFISWLLFNMIFVFFYGFLHQGGILPALNHLTKIRNKIQRFNVRVNVLSSHIYTIPKSLLTNYVSPEDNWKFKHRSPIIVYPASSSNFELSMRQLLTVGMYVDKNPPHDDLIYFIFPSSLTQDFIQDRTLKKLNLKYSLERCFYLHLSTEALPQITWTAVINLNFKHMFGLNVVIFKSAKFLQKHSINDRYFSANDKPSIQQFYNRTACSL